MINEIVPCSFCGFDTRALVLHVNGDTETENIWVQCDGCLADYEAVYTMKSPYQDEPKSYIKNMIEIHSCPRFVDVDTWIDSARDYKEELYSDFKRDFNMYCRLAHKI